MRHLQVPVVFTYNSVTSARKRFLTVSSILYIFIRITDGVGLSPILCIIHPVIIGTMLNNNGLNNRHGLKTLRVNKPFLVLLLQRRTFVFIPSFFRSFIQSLLPPANEVWGKVMFLHLSVILFIGLECLSHCLLGYTPPRQSPPWADAPNRHPPGRHPLP